ncbi:Xylose isomerase domain protein TIM barrel [uncultured delta proteobacterium]|uniref:Xylose isomerase domain protein TIM barrel n=1 Tax=uncultured delta proteobacterium TaxID=34034 RepID=A0A212JY25_9DELT|nr:Xylose isomerase domain protein TIM barrel [uncultured delta proteobacterium]
MPCYVNLPARWIHAQPAWSGWFVNGRVAPEFGLDAASIALPDAWHKDMAARFRDAGLACSVHLPFWGVDPGDPDDARASRARDDLRRGAELAGIYGARHMIGHPYYRTNQREKELDRWLETSRAIWPELPKIAGAPLFLENTYETSPDAIAVLAATLQGEAASGPLIGVCFDVGHWRSFAGKSAPAELDPWLDAFCPFALHLHLHDNDGSLDQHLGLGKGAVPYAALFAKLDARRKSVTATLEPHDTEAFAASIGWLAENKPIAAALGWEEPRMEALPLAEIAKNIVKE